MSEFKSPSAMTETEKRAVIYAACADMRGKLSDWLITSTPSHGSYIVEGVFVGVVPIADVTFEEVPDAPTPA